MRKVETVEVEEVEKAEIVETISLVPQIVDAVGIPVVAAGGIADARGITAAFALGAEGVQMGTVFLAGEESGTSSLHREAIGLWIVSFC